MNKVIYSNSFRSVSDDGLNYKTQVHVMDNENVLIERVTVLKKGETDTRCLKFLRSFWFGDLYYEALFFKKESFFAVVAYGLAGLSCKK